MTQAIDFTVPLTPPSVNHYAKHSRGRHYQTGDATAFKDAVCLFSRGASVQGRRFKVNLVIRLAKGQKGDVDNFPKLCLDGLAKAQVFRDMKGNPVSDAHVKDLRVIIDDKTREEQGSTWMQVGAL